MSKISLIPIPVLISIIIIFSRCNSPTGSEDVELNSDAVFDIVIDGSTIWFGTGYGLAKMGDNANSWATFTASNGLQRGGISALHIQDNEIWIAAGYDSSDFQIGSGLSYSADYGATWQFIPQPGTPRIQNITFDIAVLNGTVWLVSFGGGLRKSDDLGQTWQIVTPDTFDFNPGTHLNHRPFSVIAISNELWVGTAQGINRSIDGGTTWQNFNHQNQNEPISGNFVVALNSSFGDASNTLWAGTRRAEDQAEFNAISRTDNSGGSWITYLNDILVHNFAVNDSAVYVATNEGLYITRDNGSSWQNISEILDDAKDLMFSESEVHGVGYLAEQTNGNFGLWVGGPEGLAHSGDNGNTWNISYVDRLFAGALSKSGKYYRLSPMKPASYNF